MFLYMFVCMYGCMYKSLSHGSALHMHMTEQVAIAFYMHMWQSWVEMEHYSTVYFDHITAFKAL